MSTSQEESCSGSGAQFSKTSVMKDQRDTLRHSPTPATISRSAAATTEMTTQLNRKLHCSRCDLVHCKPPTLGSQYEAITRCQLHCSYNETVEKLSSLDSGSEPVLQHQRHYPGNSDIAEKSSTLGLRHEPTRIPVQCRQQGGSLCSRHRERDLPILGELLEARLNGDGSGCSSGARTTVRLSQLSTLEDAPETREEPIRFCPQISLSQTRSHDQTNQDEELILYTPNSCSNEREENTDAVVCSLSTQDGSLSASIQIESIEKEAENMHHTHRTCSYQITEVPCCRKNLSAASSKDFAMGQIGFRVRSISLPSNTHSQPQYMHTSLLHSTLCTSPPFPLSNSISDSDTTTASEASSWTGSQFSNTLAGSGESLLT